jgi:hypothetical protein
MKESVTLTKNYIMEGLKIKEGSKVKIVESFAGGTSASVAQKVVNILGRKAGLSFNFSDLPIDYSNSFGSFKGYYAQANTGLLLKINFLLGGSDSIESFDVYLDGLDDVPSYTVEVTGLNIIQVIDAITECLVEDGEADDGALEESVKGSKRKLVEANKRYSFLVIADSPVEYVVLLEQYEDILKQNDIKYMKDFDTYYKTGDQYRNRIIVSTDKSLNNLYSIINKIKPVKIDKFLVESILKEKGSYCSVGKRK